MINQWSPILNFQEEIIIQQSPERIFAYLQEVNNRSEYIPLLEEVILLDDPPLRVGSRYIEVSTIAGQKLRTTYQVKDWIKNRKISVQTLKSVFPIQVDLNLMEREGGTALQILLDFELTGVYRLAAPLIRAIVRQQAQDILLRLRRILEQKESFDQRDT